MKATALWLLAISAASVALADTTVHIRAKHHHHGRHQARHEPKRAAISPATNTTKVRTECPSKGSALYAAKQPALTSECPLNCAGGDLCVYFPESAVSKCDVGYANECFHGDKCAFQCIPNEENIYGWFITLYTDATVLDEVAEKNAESRPDKTAVINANVVTSWIGDGRFFDECDWLYITGNEAANNFDEMDTDRPDILEDNKYLSRSDIVEFELPESILANLPKVVHLRLENLRLAMDNSSHSLSLPSLQELYLRNMDLTTFPFENATFPQLYLLDLSVNNLESISRSSFPQSLSYLNLSMNNLGTVMPGDLPSSLESLDLGGNGLTDIVPDTLPFTIVVLKVEHNDLSRIPADVTKMKGLYTLIMDSNHLGSIPAKVIPTTQMGVLSLSNCGLRAIPSDVWDMEQLVRLYLDGNDLSDQKNFEQLPSTLERLSIFNTNLQEPPHGLEVLHQLSELWMDSNPKAMTNLSFIPSQVVILSLDNNSLVAIPEELKHLNRLTDLSLASNPIASIEPNSLPSSLHVLLMSNTSFRSLPKNALPDGLFSLFIFNSTLEELPQDVLAMRSLLELYIENCQLSSFDVGSDLPGLSDIVLPNNRLREFTGQFPGAGHLDLSGNQLESFNVTDSDKLHTLNLENNALTSMPRAIFDLKALQFLNLTGNPIRNFTPSSEDLKFLSGITMLSMEQQMFNADCNDQGVVRQWRGFTVCVVDASHATDFQSSHSGKVSAGLVLLNVVLVLALVFMVGFVFHRRRIHAKRLRAMESKPSMSDDFHTSASIWADAMLLQHRLDNDLVKRVSLVGSGMFGEVWLGEYRGEFVAIKQLKNVDNDRQLIQRFVDEIKLVASLSHPRVVQFTGVIWTKETDLAMVTEYMGGGDLRSFLNDRNDASESWGPSMMPLAVDISEAIVYLHSLDPIVIHRDLKSRNVLLDDEGRGKLSDFGSSRVIPDDEVMTSAVGTIRWIAPEVLAGKKYDESADIYSLGIIFSEIDTRKLPFDDAMDDTGEDRLTDSAIAGLIISGSLSCATSSTCPPELASLIARCTSFKPSDRPSALQVTFELRTLLQSSMSVDAC